MSMTVRHIALVSDTPRLTASDLMRASAALQKQVTRDLRPIWEIEGTVDPFEKLEDVPPDYWQIIIRDNLPQPGVEGYHVTAAQEPFALLRFRPGWELSASHECVEMMVDPFGNKLLTAFSIRPGGEQLMVDYLVEVCDPCQDEANAYVVNDLALSDFCTPDYYGPTTSATARCSFMGKLTKQRQVLPGGYLNFRDPGTQAWTRAERNNGPLRFVDVGTVPNTFHSLRAAVDDKARHDSRGLLKKGKRGSKAMSKSRSKLKGKRRQPKDPNSMVQMQAASKALQRQRARLLRLHIEGLITHGKERQ